MKISRNLCAWITILLFSLNIIYFVSVHGTSKLEIRNWKFGLMLLYCSSQFPISILISPKFLFSNFKFQAVNGYFILKNFQVVRFTVHGSRFTVHSWLFCAFHINFHPPAVGGQDSLTLNREPWNPISCELAQLLLDFVSNNIILYKYKTITYKCHYLFNPNMIQCSFMR